MSTGFLGFHMQGAVQNWPNAIKLLPAGTWCKSLNDQHLCRDLKAVNPGIKTVFRYEFNRHQNLVGNYKDLARDFFSRFIDGTFWEQKLYLYIDAIEEWNEYLANSQSSVERMNWLNWCKAVNDVWSMEYRTKPELKHIRLVSCNTAIGNDIPPAFAEVVAAHDGILGYHNYTNVYDKQVRPEDWQYYSGRWVTMDTTYKVNGTQVEWLFTEGGPTIMGTFDGQHYGGVTEGWRHNKCYNGDIDAYVNGTIQYQLDRIAAWNKTNNNRCLGGVLFTSENTKDSIWKNFHLFESEMVKVAQKAASYVPVTPSAEPPPGDWQQAAWNKSIEMQISNGIMLNAKAAIQGQILSDGFIPVQNEFQHEGRTYQAAETLDNSKSRRLYWWTVSDGVNWFPKP
jgi:hypothetical protein